jgi:hypothetical protein
MHEPQNALSPTSTKTASAAKPRPVGRALQWREVLRAIPSDDALSVALSRYRAGGHTPDDFATRRSARIALATALTACEDWLESEHPGRRSERAAARAVRRRLECELWQ